MSQHAIVAEDAANDPAVCAAYIIEGITNADAKSSATAALVGHFLSNDDVDSAAGFADGLDDPFARDGLLIQVVAKCIDLKDDEYAFQLADAVKESGLRASAIEVASLRLAARGEYERALEKAAGLEHSSETIAGVAVAQAASGLDEAASATLERVDYFKSRVFAVIEIAAENLRKNDKEKAGRWLAKAEAIVDEVEFEEDKIRALNELGNAYLDLEDMENADENFTRAAAEASKLDNIHHDGFLVASAIGLLRAGNVEAADENLDIVEDKTQVAACLYGFSRVYEKEEPEDAVETNEEAYAMLKSQSEYETRSTKARNEMFGAVAIQFQRLGMAPRAVEIAHENEDEGQRIYALTSIAQLLVMDGKESEADEVAKGIEPESEHVAAFIALSDAANTVENTQLAVDYLKRAAELLEEVEQLIARAESSDQIALRLHSYGETAAAIDLARANLGLIGELRNDSGQVEALLRLTAVYKELGIEPDDADKSLLLTMVRRVDW